MVYRGKVKDGVVILEGDPKLADGTQVTITVVPSEETVGQRLLKFAGKAHGLPRDGARNHDHYLYGTPKK